MVATSGDTGASSGANGTSPRMRARQGHERPPGEANSTSAGSTSDSLTADSSMSDSTSASSNHEARGELQRHDSMSRALGWFSIGLGAAQIVAPRVLGRVIGVGDHVVLMRVLGAREILNGVGILTQRPEQRAPWMWARVGGDVMDLGLLGAAGNHGPGHGRGRMMAATAAVAGVTAMDVYCAQKLTEQAIAPDGRIHVTCSIALAVAPEKLYQFWRDPENLPRFMRHLEAVERIDDRRSHWKVKAKGTSIEWDAEIVDDEPGRSLSWRSLEGSSVDHRGTIRFEPTSNDAGTIVRVDLEYRPPAGAVGATVAKIFGEDPETQIKGDLRAFKQLMETGEIATTRGQSSGHRSIKSRLMPSKALGSAK